MYKRQPLYSNGKFIRVTENIFKCLLVFVFILEDDFDNMVLINQNTINERHQDATVQLFDVLILLEERHPVPLGCAGSDRLLHFFFDPQKGFLLVLNDFGVAVAELKVFRLVDDPVREVFIQPELELLIPLNLCLLYTSRCV